ncbi:ABC transporter permease [Corynebacterium pilosum]|uniref:Transport permease protein n=1 Tax=Corynebacterium pilosum TaxID=35756 RepID=A0A376CLZ3_9CORY|nr:ABC transporter permease [Corynebacterium pilosum]STC69460.1 putative integral membrane protein [Corynebacterium pilosum]
MRAYRALTTAMLKSQFREPVGFFFLIIFSPALLLFLGLIFGNDPTPEFGGRGPIDNMAPGIMVMSILIIGATVLPQAQALLRTTGALTRLKMTPLKPSTYLASDMTVHFVSGVIGPVLTLLVALLVFGVDAPHSLLGLAGAIALAMVTMLAVGYALSAVMPSPGAATGLGNMLMILLMLTSGAFIPVAALSDTVQRLFEFSPSYHMAGLVDAAWQGEAFSLTSVAVLLGVAAVAGLLAVLLFRRR